MDASKTQLFLTVPLVAMLLAGCSSEPGPSYAISGVFERSTTQADLDDLQARLAPHGASAQIMESFPMQYQIRDLDADTCADIRVLLLGLAYIAAVGECRVTSGTGNPDEPTSSP